MRELKILTRKVRALASAPDHVCFSLTEDLHGCRWAGAGQFRGFRPAWVCELCARPRVSAMSSGSHGRRVPNLKPFETILK